MMWGDNKRRDRISRELAEYSAEELGGDPEEYLPPKKY